jgi:hypothetical protein
MTVRMTTNKKAGVKTIFVTGDSGKEYVVQFVRRVGMRRVSCTCPDFTFRGSTKRTHRACKHIRLARIERQNEIANRRNARLQAEMDADRAELDALETPQSVSEMTREMLEREFMRVTGLGEYKANGLA